MRAAIVLAAGESRRFGGRDKLLARLNGQPLLYHAIASALRAPVARVIVVVGQGTPRREAVIRRLGSPRIGVIRSRGSQHAGLAKALAQLRPIEREALVFLGDMPALPNGIATRLCSEPLGEWDAVRPAWRGMPGHPVRLTAPRNALDRLRRGRTPFGGKRVRTIAAGPGCTRDVDRPRDLLRFARPIQ